MRKIFILAKILLKSGIGSADKPGKHKWWIAILIIFALASFGFSMAFMAAAFYDALFAVGFADTIIPLAFGATSVVIFIFGIFYTISVMYHADDIPLLLAMPIKPYQILGAKFLTLLVYEYIFESLILLPVLVVYAIKACAGVLYAVYSVVLLLVTPVIALVISSLIVMLVMRFTRIGKNKQAFNYIGGIIAIVMAIGLNIGMRTFATTIFEGQIAAETNQLSATLNGLFPGINFASGALLGANTVDGFFNLLLFLLCAAAAITLFLSFGQLVYFKGLVGVTEAAARRKRIDNNKIEKKTAQTSITKAYIKKEIRLLVRSPVAFLNCVLINFLWPILILVMLFGYGYSIEAVRVSLSMLGKGAIIAIFVGISAFTSSANAITSTSISREGKLLYFVKFLPVEISAQLNAKILTGALLSFGAVALMAVVLVYLGVEIAVVLVALILGMAASFVCSAIGLFIDALKPKLVWINEQQAIKQNLNVLLHMLFGIIFAALIVVPVLLANFSFLATILYATVLIIIAAGLSKLSIGISSAKINNMDV